MISLNRKLLAKENKGENECGCTIFWSKKIEGG